MSIPILHTHSFPSTKPRNIVFCQESTCTEVRVGLKKGKLRELTPQEKLSLLAIQMEDLAIAQAMQIIHGKERGLQIARNRLGYG